MVLLGTKSCTLSSSSVTPSELLVGFINHCTMIEKRKLILTYWVKCKKFPLCFANLALNPPVLWKSCTKNPLWKILHKISPCLKQCADPLYKPPYTLENLARNPSCFRHQSLYIFWILHRTPLHFLNSAKRKPQPLPPPPVSLLFWTKFLFNIYSLWPRICYPFFYFGLSHYKFYPFYFG